MMLCLPRVSSRISRIGIWLRRNCHKTVTPMSSASPVEVLFTWPRVQETGISRGLGRANELVANKLNEERLKPVRDASLGLNRLCWLGLAVGTTSWQLSFGELNKGVQEGGGPSRAGSNVASPRTWMSRNSPHCALSSRMFTRVCSFYLPPASSGLSFQSAAWIDAALSASLETH